MRTKGYELVVIRGESFTLRYRLKLRDGSDYPVPVSTDAKAKWYYLLEISSSKYSEDDRYFKRWLINIKDDDPTLIEKAFDIVTTSKWLGQEYTYSIDLVYAIVEDDIDILDSISILSPTKLTVKNNLRGSANVK